MTTAKRGLTPTPQCLSRKLKWSSSRDVAFVAALFALALTGGCEALHPISWHRSSSSLVMGMASRVTDSSEQTQTQIQTQKPRSKSKFAGLMAGEVSSPSGGFPPIVWDGFASSSKSSTTDIRTAVLPDDDAPPMNHPQASTSTSTSTSTPAFHNRRMLHYYPSLLTQDEATSLHRAAERSGQFEERDSRCAVVVEDGIYQNQTSNDTTNSEQSSRLLASLLRPILEQITPWAREMYNVSTLTVADALIRSYDPKDGRQDLAPHYDVTTYAAVIVPLNDPSEYDGGLFVQTGASVTTRQGVPFASAGDAVLHRFDVMHGVNVRSGNRRFSLVVWFGETEESVATQTVPWVKREAIEHSSVHAAFLYAVNAQSGLYGIAKDMQVAKEYYTWASDQGHALAAYCLSFLLCREIPDAAANEKIELQNQSVALLEKAAAQGLACAQHELGIAYKQGYKGLSRDEDAARSWLTLAAQQGYRLSADVLDDPSRWQQVMDTED